MSTIYRAPRGTQLTCKNWQIEAAYRMLLNNLDPENAEDPKNLIVYGGTGKAARDKESLNNILHALKTMDIDDTLLIQSGKPVGILKTHTDAPRVLIANSNLVGKWANWTYFRELEQKGLMMYGQMTAGSWIYIGTQGIIQGTYETFMEAARQHFDGDLTGKLIVTGGLGGMSGAQPLAASFTGAVSISIEINPWRIDRRLEMKFVDRKTDSLDEAILWAREAIANKIPLSIALLGNCADILPELVKRDLVPDLLTDQTSAHDMLNGYVPGGMSYEDALQLREHHPETYRQRSFDSVAKHVQAMLDLQQKGAITFDYGNNIRAHAKEAGIENAFDFPGFVPAFIRPLFCEGQGPFRWVALSGDPEDIYVTDRALKELFPEKKALHRWLDMAREKISFQGLPARICWLGYGERHRAGLLFNELVRTGKVKAPIVIGRDHLDAGSVASPNRETEGMLDGSDAVADWPILNALVNAVSGATWVSYHHGGGVGIGYSLHAGQVIVADGTENAAKRLKRVLTNDPAMGVLRHADAGYESAKKISLTQ